MTADKEELAAAGSWQQISWNGISFQVPASWQPVAIYTNYLLFEDQYKPVLELKWQHITGSYSVERILKRLRSSGRKEDSMTPIPVPREWEQVLQRFNCYPFQWQGAQNTGLGLLIHCRECNLTTLLQFYIDEPQHNLVCLQILQSLSCHFAGSSRDWSIYDIRFSLPVAAELQEQEFQTGRYRISFYLQSERLYFSLLRFKPAEMLLAGKGLDSFGQQLLEHDEQIIEPRAADAQFCSWQKMGNRWQRFKASLRKHQADHLLSLRHIPVKNVILGIQARSNRAINRKLVSRILHDFSAH
jgi:hypothetical protein